MIAVSPRSWQARPPASSPRIGGTREHASIARRALLFIVLGLVVYVALYAAADQIVLRTSLRNRFFNVQTAPVRNYDVVLLGSSHATTFGFGSLNSRLEEMLGGRVLNLSLPSAGVLPNRVLLDYFLVGHRARLVVYIVDSFIFTSARWNEGQFADGRLIARAPLDLDLARLLLARPDTRWSGAAYISGLPKVNGLGHFGPDVTDDEALRFGRVYAPSKQIDAQRLRNLYLDPPDDAVELRYLADLDDMARALEERGVGLLLIKPPVTHGWYRGLPNEPFWDARLADFAARHSVRLLDYSLAVPDERLYFDADHLNRTGVLTFFSRSLVPALSEALAAG